jgi:hypothetical protein
VLQLYFTTTEIIEEKSISEGIQVFAVNGIFDGFSLNLFNELIQRSSAWTRMIITYPAMWSENNRNIPSGAISIPDVLLQHALPKVDAIIRAKLTH